MVVTTRPSGRSLRGIAWCALAFFLWTTGATTAALASPGCNCGPHGAGAGSFLQRVGDTVSAEHTGAQQRRPRDCTCITGMKTYPTTPRDELKAMGPVGLRQKAKDLKADEKSLKVQKKEQVKENAEMVEKAEELKSTKGTGLSPQLGQYPFQYPGLPASFLIQFVHIGASLPGRVSPRFCFLACFILFACLPSCLRQNPSACLPSCRPQFLRLSAFQSQLVPESS